MKNLLGIDKDRLENLIDRVGLANVVEALSEISSEKAQHIQSNWQDEDMAKRWNKAGKHLDNVAVKIKEDIGA